jgi:RNA polymerase sigma-70 factor (ECF subfamily)
MNRQLDADSERNIRTDFEHIYVTYYPRMLRFASEYVPSKADAENIVQDIFATLWEMRHIHPDKIYIASFIFTSLKNKCIDYLRHRLVVHETENLMQEEFRREMQIKYDSLEAFNHNLLQDEKIEAVIRKAIDALPEKCREIFIKNKLEGKTQKEIAREMNLSINTVETQMGIAYRKLREELKDFILLFLFIVCQ